MDKKSDQGDGQLLKKLGLFAAAMTDLVAYSGAGIGLGYFLWKKLFFPWWILLITSVLGLGMAFYQLYRLSQKEL